MDRAGGRVGRLASVMWSVGNGVIVEEQISWRIRGLGVGLDPSITGQSFIELVGPS